MTNKLNLDPTVVARARELARRAGEPVTKLARTHTTVSVERAVLRLGGREGGDPGGEAGGNPPAPRAGGGGVAAGRFPGAARAGRRRGRGPGQVPPPRGARG